MYWKVVWGRTSHIEAIVQWSKDFNCGYVLQDASDRALEPC